MWFVLEQLDPMPIAALEEAGEKLVQALRGLAPDAIISRMLLAISREPGQAAL